MTRRRFHPTSENGEVNLNELSESLPWLTGSSSDSDTSDSENKSELEKEQSLIRKLNMKWGCIRQAMGYNLVSGLFFIKLVDGKADK